MYFNPRPPRGGRLANKKHKLTERGISIHVLREEDDTLTRCRVTMQTTFQSTSSARRTTSPTTCTPTTHGGFQSTSSARRTTRFRPSSVRCLCYFNPRPPRGGRPYRLPAGSISGYISIHVLREEDDSLSPKKTTPRAIFQSTSSARRTTHPRNGSTRQH